MPRKKMVRSAKGKKAQVKRQPKMVANTVEQMEKDFRKAPAKLIAQYRIEIATLKQQEVKLKAEIKKAQILEKAVKNKHSLLVAKKASPTTKKQIVSAKKIHGELKKSITEFTAKVAKIQKLHAAHAAKQAKFSAIAKQLIALEKELSKNPIVKATAKAKATKKITRKSKKSAKSANEHNSGEPSKVDSESSELAS
jgi:hypothetical protein